MSGMMVLCERDAGGAIRLGKVWSSEANTRLRTPAGCRGDYSAVQELFDLWLNGYPGEDREWQRELMTDNDLLAPIGLAPEGYGLMVIDNKDQTVYLMNLDFTMLRVSSYYDERTIAPLIQAKMIERIACGDSIFSVPNDFTPEQIRTHISECDDYAYLYLRHTYQIKEYKPEERRTMMQDLRAAGFEFSPKALQAWMHWL